MFEHVDETIKDRDNGRVSSYPFRIIWKLRYNTEKELYDQYLGFVIAKMLINLIYMHAY